MMQGRMAWSLVSQMEVFLAPTRCKLHSLSNNLRMVQADAGGPGSVSRRMPRVLESELLVLKVPNNKVIVPPGETPMDRTVQIDGTSEQIEIAKQMVNEVIENRLRNPGMSGGYSQQSYQARPPTNWAPQPSQMQQSGGYGYAQQPGTYPGVSAQYNQQPYPGYPPQNWDQSSAPQNQQPPQGTGYDYYGQQQPQTQQPPSGPQTGNTGYNYSQPPSGPQTGNTGYNYSQPPTSGGYSQQGYSQEGYAAGYQGYSQPTANPQSGYDQRQGYGSTPGYGNVTNPPTQDGHPPAYGSYPPSQPSSQTAVAAAYGAGATQSGAYPQAYGAPPVTPPSYGQQPYYGGAYAQPAAYPADDNGAATAAAAAVPPVPVPVPHTAAQPNGAAKASP